MNSLDKVQNSAMSSFFGQAVLYTCILKFVSYVQRGVQFYALKFQQD